MMHQNERIDRHKVAACYMIAIAYVSPMRFDTSIIQGSKKHYIVNELLAITVGLSILRAFILAAIDASEIKNESKITLKNRIMSGLMTPDGKFVHHGEYALNYANELYYSVKDGKCCILSIAHELYLLELFSLYIGNDKALATDIADVL